MVNIRAVFCATVFLILAGCKPASETATAASSQVPVEADPPPPPPLITKADWQAAVKSTYEEASTKTNKDGITEFSACFKRTATKECTQFLFGRRDAFNRLTTFTPISSELSKNGTPRYLHSYVSLVDCKSPVIVLRPHYFSKGGWLFMNRVAVMADGNVVLEHKFDNTEIQRDAHTWGVDEEASWVASSSDVDGLKKVVDAKVVIVRLAGVKGYVTVDEKDVRNLKDDFKAVT
jgi:hypothetical protein